MNDSDGNIAEDCAPAPKLGVMTRAKNSASDMAHSPGVAFAGGALSGAVQGGFYGSLGWLLLYGMAFITPVMAPVALATLAIGGAAIFGAVQGIKAVKRNSESPEYRMRQARRANEVAEEQIESQFRAEQHAPPSQLLQDQDYLEETFADRELARRSSGGPRHRGFF